MELKTPEGVLKIEGNDLSFIPTDDGPDIHVKLSPAPESRYERGIYGLGTLVIAGHVIVLKNDQAPVVVAELRKPRADANKARNVADGDRASTK